MRLTLSFLLLLFALTANGDEPRINRIPANVKEEARAAVERAVAQHALREGSAFAELVQCGPRLWAAIHDRIRSTEQDVVKMTIHFDGASRAQAWGFRLVEPEDPQRKQVSDALAQAASRVPVEAAAFRDAGTKLLGPQVAKYFASPARVVVRDATDPEVGYLWVLVPYDLDEPIFTIQIGPTRLLVTLDRQHRIDWIDLVPDGV